MLTRAQFISSACSLAAFRSFPQQEVAKSAWKPGAADYHLENDGSASYEIELKHTIRAPFKDPKSVVWELFLPEPPSFERQLCAGGTTTRIDEVPDATILRVRNAPPAPRTAQFVRLNGDVRVGSGWTASTKFQLTIIGKKLVPGRGSRPAPLANPDFYLRTSANIDFKNTDFQRWLDETGLRRGKDEGDFDFGHRSFLYVHKHTVHDIVAKSPPPSYFNASRLCKDRVMGCAHSANLHVAILRANGVPARVLCGRHARSSDQGSLVWHVRADFWCESIGWIPVNHGIAAENYDPEEFFGKFPTTFVTLLEDNDLDVMRYRGGRTTIPLMQSVQTFWSAGRAPETWTTTEKWTVEKIAQATISPPTQKPNLLPALTVPAWDSDFEVQQDAGAARLLTTEGKERPRGWFTPRDALKTLTNGEKYFLEFRARADRNRDIAIRSTSVKNRIFPIGLDEPIGLTPEWQTFGITFHAGDIGADGSWAPVFLIPREAGAIWLADVTLQKAAL